MGKANNSLLTSATVKSMAGEVNIIEAL